MFQFYIAKAVEFFGLTSARPIYERALEVLSDKYTREMGLRFAELEMKLGEAERARAIYGHISQLCDPRVDHKFWKVWHDFEVRHGNEETFKEMLRIKRSVQTRYNNEVDFLASQMISNKKRAEAAAAASAAAIAKPSMTFVSGGTTVNGRKVEGGSAAAGTDGKPAAARAVNPDEIAMDLDDDAGEAIAVEAEDEGGAKSAVQFVGAKDRFKAATATAVVSNPDEIAMDDD